MRNLSKSLIVTLALSVTSVAIASSAQAILSNQSKLSTHGIDKIRVGMTIAEASQAAGVQLKREGASENPTCYYVKPTSNPQGLGFMVTNGRISRVDVWSNPQITTLSGAKIGDSEARIKALYPGQIKVSPHPYRRDGGHYLTFVPKDQGDRNYRVIFETDGKKVLRFRSGKLPEVDYIEGCS